MNEPYQNLLSLGKELQLVSDSASLLSWDQEVLMPSSGIGYRGEQMANGLGKRKLRLRLIPTFRRIYGSGGTSLIVPLVCQSVSFRSLPKRVFSRNLPGRRAARGPIFPCSPRICRSW